jgi:hypothetical protein
VILKVLFLISLCFFTASIIYNISMVTPSATEEWSCRASTNAAHTGYLAVNGTELQKGDPIGGDGWP